MTLALPRRTLLAGGAGLLLAGCAKQPITLVTPTASPTGTVRQQLTQVMDAYGRNTEQLGVSLTDLRTGAGFGFRPQYASQSASVAKVMIVTMALRQARAAGGELSFADYGRASRAIIDSDNDSADALWGSTGGRASYDRLATDLGLPDTRSDSRSEFWSWTNTTPSDQRQLVELLAKGTPAVHVDDRLYLLDLMGKTNAAQTWGVGHPRDTDVRVRMKNGWVQFKSLDNLWAVNSIGHVVGEGRDYVAAVMCRMPTFEAGRKLCDAIGASLFDVLGTGQLT